MRKFDDDITHYIYEEFKKIDEFYVEFKDEFKRKQLNIILQYKPDFKHSEQFEERLDQFAHSALNVAHTIIDKDKTYPEFRLKDELLSMQTYLAKAIELTKNKELAAEMHRKTKKLLVKYYPSIVDLSSEGFRLMELNLNFLNMEFIANFNRMEGS